MNNISFDICAIPIYALILYACRSRHMGRDNAHRLYIMMNVVSLMSVVADLWMEFVVYPTPLSTGAVVLGSALSYTYKLLRNSSLVIYMLFIFAITRTDHLIRSRKARFLIWMPNAALLLLLIQNLFTHNVFAVTADGGYARGPMLMAFYIIALMYGIAGTAYCAYCKRYLDGQKWVSLISVYLLTCLSVYVQFVRPELHVEMFATVIGLLMIMLLVMRPEETLDIPTGLQNWNAFQTDLRNMLLSRERMQLAVFRFGNAQDIRGYIGDKDYAMYVKTIADALEHSFDGQKLHYQIYFEYPGSLYVTIDEVDYDLEASLPALFDSVRERIRRFMDLGVRCDLKLCLIRYPDDLTEMQDILHLCRIFQHLGPRGQTFSRASDIVKLRDFEIENHIEEILNRAVTGRSLEMYYQPIYNLKTHRFSSAEALARLRDEKYGMIPPGIFIAAAERSGLILPLGEVILESVFRFMALNDLEALGLSCVEINLSVAQCLQRDLPATIVRLQKKYGIAPEQVNFEITESIFDNVSQVMEANLRQLSNAGYSFSLDDFGTGYSNIQRMIRLPLSIIKIDKSLVDGMFTEDGGVIIRNTVSMMKGIRKKLVVEGVETRGAVDALSDMSCDYIQGFYYSKPLPADDFLAFLKEHRVSEQ